MRGHHMHQPDLQELVDLATDQCDLGLRRHDQIIQQIQKDYKEAWEKMDRARTKEDLKEAWKLMNAVCAKEAEHLDKVAGWLKDSHEKIVGGFYAASERRAD